jgi:hypothetical protein
VESELFRFSRQDGENHAEPIACLQCSQELEVLLVNYFHIPCRPQHDCTAGLEDFAPLAATGLPIFDLRPMPQAAANGHCPGWCDTI